MNWINLTEEAQLSTIKELSKLKPQIIFKHSTRCNISSIVKNRLERGNSTPEADFYYLDLIQHRQLSDKIAEGFSVYHESPQILIIKNGDCVYDESHNGINIEDIIEQVFST